MSDEQGAVAAEAEKPLGGAAGRQCRDDDERERAARAPRSGSSTDREHPIEREPRPTGGVGIDRDAVDDVAGDQVLERPG